MKLVTGYGLQWRFEQLNKKAGLSNHNFTRSKQSMHGFIDTQDFFSS